jgi:hypothetical protein
MSDVARAFGKTVTNNDISDDDTIIDAVFDESRPLLARPKRHRQLMLSLFFVFCRKGDRCGFCLDCFRS